MELEEIQKKVGAKMRKAREGAALSQKDLKEISGLGKGYISDCELGKKNLTLDTIRKYSNCCNVPAKDFFDWEE